MVLERPRISSNTVTETMKKMEPRGPMDETFNKLRSLVLHVSLMQYNRKLARCFEGGTP